MTRTLDPRTGQSGSDTQTQPVGAAETPNGSHSTRATHTAGAAVGPVLLADQTAHDAHASRVGEAQTPEQATLLSAPTSGAPVRAPLSAADHTSRGTHLRSVGGGPVSPAANPAATPKVLALPGIPSSDNGQGWVDAHDGHAVVALTPPAPAISSPTPIEQAPVLVDHHLAVLANRVNDLENFRKASANQLEALTRTGEDKDGEERGYGLPADHPAVIQSQAIVDAIKKIEDQTVRELEKKLKKTPMGPWILSQKGLGAKTIARLLAATGDPYWNSLHDRPRTVSELWSFCGYRPGQKKAKGEQMNWSPEAKMRAHLLMDPIKKLIRMPCYRIYTDKNGAEVQVFRSADAPAGGAYLRGVHIEGGCACSGYRVMYDLARDKYRDTLHPADCVRCGPAGKPALAGSVRSAKHQDAMAYRLVKKAILRDLWREAARLHGHPGDQSVSEAQVRGVAGAFTSDLPGDQDCFGTQNPNVAGAPNSSAGQTTRDNQSSFASGGQT